MKGARPLNNKEIRRVSACFDGTFVKGGEVSRAVLVNRDSRQAIENVIGWHRDRYGNTAANRPLFPSRNGQGSKSMSRRTMF